MAHAVVFPGQGAQSHGMGLPWQDHASWSVVERAEKVLDQPLADLLTADTHDLSRTANSQMSVLLTSLMCWDAVRPTIGRPAAFAGHSLGQITALIAAEALSFDDGLRLAWERANLTQRDADTRPGRMAALLGATPDQAEQACADVEGCWVANDNTAGQIVIAGTPEGVEAGTEAAKQAGVRKVMALDVGGAFHTPLFESAAADLRRLLDEIDWRDTDVPVISNGDGAAVGDGRGWPDRLESHLVQPVRWRACMETIAGLSDTWIEAGPGSTLAAFAKRAHTEVRVLGVSTPADVNELPREGARLS
ncbi:MAG TPA: ACP S-malonyltransferase [Acidimicrobiales bacterium]|nr:ACP S-malonyltransferase [Acidimicrobiales bacterium]